MKLFAATLLALTSLAASAQAKPAPNRPVETEHSFIIHNFHTESGVVLPEAKIVYGTYGHLNADGSNAILLPSHYMANMHGYEWLIGARSRQAVPHRHRALRQRPLLLAQQHPRALPRPALPRHDHPR
jgi:hypothetical protein